MSSETSDASLNAADRTGSLEAPGSAAEDVAPREELPKKKLKLRSLAPEYKGDHHSLYVRHLEQAIEGTKNRNIALTGRYGAGKSSVLDAFEKKHEAKTVRISINTLGPDEDDEDLTNRIQKELVKQLVYRLKPGQLRRSRFARPKPITKWTALWQALGVSAVVLSLLWLLGIRPSADWPGAQANMFVQLSLGLLFFVLVVLVVWSVRWLIGDKFVSEVSTAGTKIALSDGPTTYFDSFLDEIVAFFDAVEPEFVIFEDLDRFDDPQIFDSLRELNTLVNASVHWKSKEQPLRFIYAIKDSLFEQLGSDSALKEDTRPVEDPSEAAVGKPSVVAATPNPDLAAEAVRRANRTKFFEMVIPIVPFLSHRNARDHLSDALTALGLPKDFVSRPLLDLVARHTTDMRLMINICNEFAVFVERLLWSKNPAPGMTADHLFALVAYKNFHMADFENIAQRVSTLDSLERHHRDEVRALIEELQKQRRTKVQLEEYRTRKVTTASALGQRLQDMKGTFPNPYSNYPVTFVVGGEAFSFDAAQEVDFWAQVATNRAITVSQTHAGSASISADQIDRLFPELKSTAHWRNPDAEALARTSQRCDEDIATLRGTDFVGLAEYERVPKNRTKFEQRINNELKSELARDLVRKGFITRNFAEYSAIFYGNFVGVDVAYFYNHSVQPNEMYLDFHFTSVNAARNLLEQVSSDFTSTVSALNIDIVDYLLTAQPEGAQEVAAYIASHDTNTDVQTFLEAYFNTPDAQHEALAELLAAHPWRSVFDYLAGHHAIPDEESRLRIFNAALLSAQSADSYELGEATVELLDAYHSRMTAITAEHPAAEVARVFEILEAVELLVPDLNHMSKTLRDHIVAAHMYEISVPNLKLALGVESAPTLDEIRKNKHVWEHCRSKIEDYLEAMQADENIEWLLLSEQVLVDVINEQHASWTGDQLRAAIDGSADAVAIADIQEVPESIWPMLVESHHALPSAKNVVEYVKVHGVDEHLAGLLSPDGIGSVEMLDVDAVEDGVRAELAIKLLNASEHLTVAARVSLAGQARPADGFDLASVTASPDQLLARGLEAELFEDDLGTFTHFAPGGWDAMSDAFEVSTNVVGFLSPEIVHGFVAEFLGSPKISEALKLTVVGDLSRYVPTDDPSALRAAGLFARTSSFKLTLDEVRRIARVTKSQDVLRQLVLSAKDATPDQVIDILVFLGSPYDRLADGPGAKFDHPGSVPSLDTVFRYLEGAGRIKITRKVLGPGRTVEVLI